jgi:hypothetical protein
MRRFSFYRGDSRPIGIHEETQIYLSSLKPTTSLTRPVWIHGTTQQFRPCIIRTGGIAHHPATFNPAFFLRTLGRLNVEGNGVETVPTEFELIAVAAFDHGVGFTLEIQIVSGLRVPV